jgi:E3 ubiquitin-protein ligase HERC2
VSRGHSIDCFIWGKGGDAALGLGSRSDQRDPEIVEFDDEDLSIVALAAGPHHTAAIDSSGALWTWGKSSYGVLGLGKETTSHLPSPRRVSFPTDAGRVVSVDCGDFHTAAVTGVECVVGVRYR